MKIEIWDFNGRKLWRRDISDHKGNTWTLDAENLPSGLYFIRIHYEEGNFYKKFIKN